MKRPQATRQVIDHVLPGDGRGQRRPVGHVADHRGGARRLQRGGRRRVPHQAGHFLALANNDWTRWEPINPVAPVTRTLAMIPEFRCRFHRKQRVATIPCPRIDLGKLGQVRWGALRIAAKLAIAFSKERS